MYQQNVFATEEGLLSDRELDTVTGGGLKEKAAAVVLGAIGSALWDGVKWVARKIRG